MLGSTSERWRIWEAQGKHCSVCGEHMHPIAGSHPTRGWTIDHVYNRASRRYLADGNKLVCHRGCNQRKADREPTGCELILLHMVNARLGFELVERPYGYTDTVIAPTALAVALERALAA